jgi:AP-1 complex subunit sigma 1/2
VCASSISNVQTHTQAYYILDELFINGELQESSKKEVLSVCAQMDEMMDESIDDGSNGKGGSKGKGF